MAVPVTATHCICTHRDHQGRPVRIPEALKLDASLTRFDGEKWQVSTTPHEFIWPEPGARVGRSEEGKRRWKRLDPAGRNRFSRA